MSVHAAPTPTAPPVHRAPLHLPVADRVQLLLALCCALTGTPWGVAMAAVVLAVLGARRAARHSLQHSVATGRAVLAPAQHPDVLDAARETGQAVARS